MKKSANAGQKTDSKVSGLTGEPYSVAPSEGQPGSEVDKAELILAEALEEFHRAHLSVH